MKQVYKIDIDGYYLEPVIIGDEEKLPDDCVYEQPPSFYKAKWQYGEWLEDGQAPVTDPAKPSLEDKIALLEKENELLKLQNKNLADQYEFLEDVVEELIIVTMP
jgi:hypothetical protein